MRTFTVEWVARVDGHDGGRTGKWVIHEKAVRESATLLDELVDGAAAEMVEALVEMELATRPADLTDEERSALLDLWREMRDDGDAFEAMGDVGRCDLARGYAERIGGMMGGTDAL